MNKKMSNIRSLFSKGISRLCEAPFLAIPTFIILNLFLNKENFLVIELICLFFGTIIPIIIVLTWSKLKKVDIDYSNKEHRNYPFLIVIFVYFLGTFILWLLASNPLITALMFCYATNTLIVFFINLKWKISVHSMGITGPTTALMLFNPLFFILGLLGPLVMWSRVNLRKHTILQVLLGSILGYILTFVQIYYLTKLMGFNLNINFFIISVTMIGLSLPPLVLSLTGYLNDKGVHDGYTRKMFHFMAFGSFFVFLSFFPSISTIALVLSGSISISIACFGGLEFQWLRGMRRKSDHPNETFYVILPLISSLMWIGFGSLFFSKTIVLIGTACVAICDALAEPVGVKFGRHKYNVKAIIGKPSQRSIEGSLSIFFSAVLITFLLTSNVILSLITSAVLTLVESISPRGTDNITVPLSTAIIIMIWFLFLV